MLKRWNNFILESNEETIISKKIQFLKDIFIDLKDDGYDVNVKLDQIYPRRSKYGKDRMTICVSIFDKYASGSPESVMNNEIYNREEVKSIINGLESNGITPISIKGGYYDGKRYLDIQFNRYGNSHTIPVRML